ncbi:hypothetical protein JCM11641_004878 [Rhodosporidiobolus odoratus]
MPQELPQTLLKKPNDALLFRNVGALSKKYYPNNGADPAWIKAIKDHIDSNYDEWNVWQALQANNYLLAMQRRLKNARDNDRDALKPSLEDINEILETLVQGQQAQQQFVSAINEWLSYKWPRCDERGQEAIAKSLLKMVEEFKKNTRSMEGYEDAVIGKLNAALSTVEHTPPSAMHPLMTLDQGFGVEHWKGPMHPDLHRGRRSPELPSIGHRAAKHYGTTKARWEAGYRW